MKERLDARKQDVFLSCVPKKKRHLYPVYERANIMTAKAFGASVNRNVERGDDPSLHIRGYNVQNFPAVTLQAVIQLYRDPSFIKFSLENQMEDWKFEAFIAKQGHAEK